jgi:hypothetical protein
MKLKAYIKSNVEGQARFYFTFAKEEYKIIQLKNCNHYFLKRAKKMEDSPVLSLHAKNVPQTVRQSQMYKIKDAKKISSFFLVTYPQAHYLQSLKFNFLLKFCVKIPILLTLFQSAQHLYEKREGSAEPDPYI